MNADAQNRFPHVAYLDPTARVHGLVEIGENASLWPYTVIRAESRHVRIGRCTNLQDHVMVHVGYHAPTVVGDYFAGPSHVLPTNRTARFFSPLGVPDFVKRTSVIRYSGRGIERFGAMIEKFAIAEGLTGHARSITIRNNKA